MSKDLEALERIETFLKENCKHYKQDIGYIKQALQRLESIDNAKPSEALSMLLEIKQQRLNFYGKLLYNDKIFFETLEPTLLKAQEQEKVLKCILENIELDENYDEQGSGSTKAYKLIIPNCISVDEDDDYTDDCYPNSDFETIDSFIKEVAE